MRSIASAADLTKLIHPISKTCYYETLTYGQQVTQIETQQIQQLLDSFISSLVQQGNTNQKSFNQRLKALQPNPYNIVSDDGIEWGLREKMLSMTQFMYENRMSLQFSNIAIQQDNLHKKGYLEVYGVSPYRHLNNYMSDYQYIQQDGCIHFSKRNYQYKNINKKDNNQVQNIIAEGIKKEKGIMTKAKDAIFKFNHIFSNSKEVEESVFARLKSKIEFNNSVKARDVHILVQDYEITSDLNIQVIKDGEVLDFGHLHPQQQSFYIRTETLYDPKESESTRSKKHQVLTDFNWIMRGNPWVWVKRFDLQK